MREDWVEVDIETVFATLENGKKINQGWSPQCKKYPSPSEDIWGVLKTTAIQKNKFLENENKELPSDKPVREYLEVKANDILLTCAGPRNRCGVACRVQKTRKKLLLSGKMYRFRVNQDLMLTEFMTLFLQSQKAWLAIDKMKTGSSDSGLNLTHARFRKLPSPIAPLPEQRAIVAKIETLFSSLDSGIADLKKAQAQLKIYRQAVLKKAFEGELTKEWRAQQKDLPSADELLEQIKAERQKHYKQQVKEWEKAVADWEENGKVGKKPGKVKKAVNIEPFSKTELNKLPDVPSIWKIVKTIEIIDTINNGYTPKSNYLLDDHGEIPFLKVYNLNFDGTLNFKKNPTFIPDEIHRKELSRSICYPNDVLINIVGPPLGKVSIVASKYPEWNINQAIVLFRPNQWILSKYISYFLQNPVTVNWLEGTSKATAGQYNVKVSTCREIPLFFCSLKEQHQIVQEIESRLSVCDKVEECIEASLSKAKALRQSILKKAFEGRLLTEAELAACKKEPDWEPAAVLLERIKEERQLSRK